MCRSVRVESNGPPDGAGAHSRCLVVYGMGSQAMDAWSTVSYLTREVDLSVEGQVAKRTPPASLTPKIR